MLSKQDVVAFLFLQGLEGLKDLGLGAALTFITSGSWGQSEFQRPCW